LARLPEAAAKNTATATLALLFDDRRHRANIVLKVRFTRRFLAVSHASPSAVFPAYNDLARIPGGPSPNVQQQSPKPIYKSKPRMAYPPCMFSFQASNVPPRQKSVYTEVARLPFDHHCL
jgi:hypothetical protein